MLRSKLMRILCLGDSLTSGWTSYNSQAPKRAYAIRLKEVLEHTLPETKVEITVDGQGFATVREQLMDRLLAQFEQHGRGLDWVIIIGGESDIPNIASGAYSVTNTFNSLKALWETSLEQGAEVLATTVPEWHSASLSSMPVERMDKHRDELNALILQTRIPHLHVFDLAAAIPHNALSASERQRLWADPVHRTELGYDEMGERIADELLRIELKGPARVEV